MSFCMLLTSCMTEWCRWLDNNDPRMFTIPLITDTESQPLCILRQCRKFLRDVPREVSIPPEQQSSQSSPSREPSPVVARKKAKDRVKQPRRDQIGTLPVRASKSNLQSRKRRHDEESLDEHHVRKHMKLESRVKVCFIIFSPINVNFPTGCSQSASSLAVVRYLFFYLRMTHGFPDNLMLKELRCLAITSLAIMCYLNS